MPARTKLLKLLPLLLEHLLQLSQLVGVPRVGHRVQQPLAIGSNESQLLQPDLPVVVVMEQHNEPVNCGWQPCDHHYYRVAQHAQDYPLTQTDLLFLLHLLDLYRIVLSELVDEGSDSDDQVDVYEVHCPEREIKKQNCLQVHQPFLICV